MLKTSSTSKGRGRPAIATLALLGSLMAAGSAGAGGSPRPLIGVPPDSTPARTDSLDSTPRYRLDEPIESTAALVDLREIISRCVDGEKTKLAGHRDMTLTIQERVVAIFESRKSVLGATYLMYSEDSGLEKRVPLREWHREFKRQDGEWLRDTDREEEAKVEVKVEVSQQGEGLSRLPFFLEDQQEFDFELLDRTLEGDHVIFKIGFQPRTAFKPLPSGVVYVDTEAYRIIHEEFDFAGRSPLPLFIKNIGRVSRHWEELPTGEWVVSRIMASMELRGSWTGKIPEQIEVALKMSDYRFDRGYDRRRFGER